MSKKAMPWSLEDLAHLSMNFKTTSLKVLAAELERTPSSVKAKYYEACYVCEGKRIVHHRWTPKQLGFLRENVGKLRLAEISKELNISIAAVQRQSRRLYLHGENKNITENHIKKWSKEDEAYLVEHFFTLPRAVLVQRLKRTEKAIETRYHRIKSECKIKKPHDWKDHEVQFVAQNKDLMSYRQMANHLGIPPKTIWYKAQKLNQAVAR